MDFADKTPAQILNEAADNLEKGTWYQRTFIKFIDQKPCFCAHGSIQYCGNKNFYDAVEKDKIPSLVAVAAVAAAGPTAMAEAVEPIEYWDKHYAEAYPQYRNLFLAHLYAWKAGLSYYFNDQTGRTKEEVIIKLREAAQLASTHG